MLNRSFFALFVLLFSVGFIGDANASLQYILADHPDGNQAPPPYGLRLDNIDGSGVFTWQFTRPNTVDPGDWQQARLEISADGTTVHIFGNMYGGRTDGNDYDYDSGDIGVVELDYYYRTGVSLVGDRVEVTDDPTSNALTSNGGTLAVAASESNEWFSGFNFFDKGDGSGISFIFDNDGHRLNGHPGYDPLTTYVGRGWHKGVGSGTRDFLFSARAIPEPTTLMIWSLFGIGCAGAGLRRRKS